MIKAKQILLHSGLFLLTLLTTTIAGVVWLNIDPFDLRNLTYGLPYSLSLLFILTCHEFGHYIAARYHGVQATLPYYIPFPNFVIPYLYNPFGTMGAVIRTKSPIPSKKVLFDIGVAGPLAGFAATLIVLIYGFTHLPDTSFIITIHPNYFIEPQPAVGLKFGSTILYDFLSALLTDPTKEFVPPMSEMYHYPYLCTGWFGLFVTAMNLIPVGQLDGGHISYAMFGYRHKILANAAMIVLLILGFADVLQYFGFPFYFGWLGWLVWAMLLLFVVKIYHPEIPDDEELDQRRLLIGWIAFFILIVCFAPSALYEG